MKAINRKKMKDEAFKLFNNSNMDIYERTPKITKKICLKDNKINLLLGMNVYFLQNQNYYNLIQSLIEEIEEISPDYIEVVDNL